jgi:hypothetical protein
MSAWAAHPCYFISVRAFRRLLVITDLPARRNQKKSGRTIPAARCDAVFLIANRSKRVPISLQSLEPSLIILLQIIRNRKKWGGIPHSLASICDRHATACARAAGPHDGAALIGRRRPIGRALSLHRIYALDRLRPTVPLDIAGKKAAERRDLTIAQRFYDFDDIPKIAIACCLLMPLDSAHVGI